MPAPTEPILRPERQPPLKYVEPGGTPDPFAPNPNYGHFPRVDDTTTQFVCPRCGERFTDALPLVLRTSGSNVATAANPRCRASICETCGTVVTNPALTAGQTVVFDFDSLPIINGKTQPETVLFNSDNF